MTQDELDRRFDFHPADQERGERHAAVRDACKTLAAAIIARTQVSREQSLAITHVEDAMMWANAAIARQ